MQVLLTTLVSNHIFTNDYKYSKLKFNIRRMSLVEQELLTLPEHLSSPPVFSGVRVPRSLVLCVCFADRCLSFVELKNIK
jgi:hypothetical protein